LRAKIAFDNQGAVCWSSINIDQTGIILQRMLKPWIVRYAVFVTLIVLVLVAIFSLGGGWRRSAQFDRERNRQTPPAESVLGDPLQLFTTRPIGKSFDLPPKISHVQMIDLDGDGLKDVLVCDCSSNTVSWIRQQPEAEFNEIVILDNVFAPARAECVDVDRDGDLDILVAVLGQLFPSNEKIGSLVALENDGQENFSSRILLQNVARVSDVRAADLDGDNDIDLAVTHFGYNEGEMRWMENVGSWEFSSHMLQKQAGGIHGVIADINGDQLNDITLLMSQQYEEIDVFLNAGRGKFKESKVYSAGNPDFGSAGIWLFDLDRDGDLDILYCNGDAFDYSPPRPWPWHGLQWLENSGTAQFRNHRLADFGGAVCAQASDFDGDGDIDIFASSAFNDWETPLSQSLILLENSGTMQFVAHPLANTPTHIQTFDTGDINGDGRLDLVTGGMHISDPYDRLGRVLLWLGNENMPVVKTPGKVAE